MRSLAVFAAVVAGPPVAARERSALIASASGFGLVVSAFVAVLLDEVWGLALMALVSMSPAIGLMFAVRCRNILWAGLVTMPTAMVLSILAVSAAGRSSTAGLAVLWAPFVGVPLVMTLVLADRVMGSKDASPDPAGRARSVQALWLVLLLLTYVLLFGWWLPGAVFAIAFGVGVVLWIAAGRRGGHRDEIDDSSPGGAVPPGR